MLLRYVDAAMRRARYEILPEDATYYGEITGFDGVYANAATLEACREELQSVLEDFLQFRISQHLDTPEVDGLGLEVPAAV